MAKAIAMIMALVVAVMSSVAVAVVRGQALPPCASALLPCAASLQDPMTTPPLTCCMPLTQAVDTELSCVCSLLASPDILMLLNTTGDQALLLLSSCGVATLDLCSAPASLPSGPPSSSPPSPPLSPASKPSASPSTSPPSPPLPPASQPSTSPSSPASEPSHFPPPPSQGSPVISEAYHVHWIALSSFMSLFLTWWSIIV